jgi:3-oxoadipate enol-lactonase
VRLAYRLDGPIEAPVLVLSNSLGSTWRMWDGLLPALTERFRVLRYEHRGHLDSEVPAGPYRIEDIGRDLLGLLDELGLDRVSLAGLSLGGMTGMWLAAHHKSRVDRLALLCTSALLGPATMWRDRAELVRAKGTEAIVEGGLRRWLTEEFIASDPIAVRLCREMMTSTPAEGYAGCCEAIATMDLRPDLAAITAPTLVIAGADDPATPPSHAEVIAAGIDGARLRVVPHAAHLATVEAPAAITELLLDHLLPEQDL